MCHESYYNELDYFVFISEEWVHTQDFNELYKAVYRMQVAIDVALELSVLLSDRTHSSAQDEICDSLKQFENLIMKTSHKIGHDSACYLKFKINKLIEYTKNHKDIDWFNR